MQKSEQEWLACAQNKFPRRTETAITSIAGRSPAFCEFNKERFAQMQKPNMRWVQNLLFELNFKYQCSTYMQLVILLQHMLLCALYLVCG